jgi:hypothetical protein
METDTSRINGCRRKRDHLVEARHAPGRGKSVDWSFGEVSLSMLVLLVLFELGWMFCASFADALRRRDLSGRAKAAWIASFVTLPFVGVLAYVIARPTRTDRLRLAERPGDPRTLAERSGHPSLIRHSSSAEEIAKLARLCGEGQITIAEYQELKARAMR